MDHFQQIYRTQAVQYDRMISAEDCDGNLALYVARLLDSHNCGTIVDVGTGTGRIPRLIASVRARVLAFDSHRAMLLEQISRAPGARIPRKSPALIQADARHIPIQANSADLIIAGWALGHFCGWYAGTWKAEIQAALDEMHRITRLSGGLVIFETLGTGTESPAPPTEQLSAYYKFLEAEHGFSREVLSTDYQFASAADAADSMEFFFGPALSTTIRACNWSRVPEFTGVWRKTRT